MATSGQVLGQNYSGERSYLNWQVNTQDTVNNQTLINWQAGWTFPSNTCRGLRNGDAGINGTYVWYNHNGGDGVHGFNSGHLSGGGHPNLQLASGSIWVGHNVDGTKNVTMSVTCTGWNSGPTMVSTGVASFDLPTIPRLNNAPSQPVLAPVTQTSIFATWSDGGGGAPVTSRQIGYGTNPSTPDTIVSADGTDLISGLNPGVTYYVWARTVNVVGNSPWSPRAQATTIAGARVRDGGTWKQAIPYVRDGGVWKLARPWVKSLGEWKEGQ